MINQLNEYITTHSIPGNNNPVIAGVSGGIDSMVLMHLMHRAGYNVTAAHCNFSLRGKESDSDQEFVTEKCRQAGIPLHSVRFNTTSYAGERGISIQMAARELRFRWFTQLAQKLSISYIALAHNRNDIAETVLINLMRGTGLAGLTGMKPVNKNIIRPLLFASRDMIESYAVENNISFREDSSNSEIKYARNRIRHILLPAMEEISEGSAERLVETADRLSGAYDIVASEIAKVFNQIFTEKEGLVYVSRSELKSVKPQGTYIFELFRKYGISARQIDELIRLLDSPSGKIINTPSHRILSDRDKIIIEPQREPVEAIRVIASEESLLSSGSLITAEKAEPGSFKPLTDAAVAWVDAGKLNYPLTIRKWIYGDSFQPFGMGGKSKKVSDILTDCKLSIFQKEKVYLLLSGNEIVWVIGIRADERFRITPQTSSAIKISATESLH